MPIWFHTHSRVPPVAHALPIFDCLGEPFWIAWADTAPYDYLHLIRDSTRARLGSLFWMENESGDACLVDLWIATSYRNRGLGILLLHTLLTQGASWGIKRISVKIEADEAGTFLPQWLQRMGFRHVESAGSHNVVRFETDQHPGQR